MLFFTVAGASAPLKLLTKAAFASGKSKNGENFRATNSIGLTSEVLLFTVRAFKRSFGVIHPSAQLTN